LCNVQKKTLNFWLFDSEIEDLVVLAMDQGWWPFIECDLLCSNIETKHEYDQK